MWGIYLIFFKAWDCTRHKAKQGNPIVNEMSNTNE
jgi:hypothetical protein